MRSAARTGGIALLLTLCAVALGACGGGGDDDDASASENSREEAGLRFAECMREHGIDVPDPQPGGEIQIGGPGSADIPPPSDPAFQDAFEACESELGEAGPADLSAEERQELEDAALEFAQCMREHGIDMPDPQVGSGPGGGFGMIFEEGAAPDSPAFQEASQACEKFLPERPGGEGS